MPEQVDITIEEFIKILKNKKCNTPHNVYLAEHLLNDKDHPITALHIDDFSLRDIFDYITITND